MAERNCIAPNKDFFHQQTQNLLPHCDVQHLGSYQNASTPLPAYCSLMSTVHFFSLVTAGAGSAFLKMNIQHQSLCRKYPQAQVLLP